MLGAHREIWPKERQPSCQVLVFPGKSNWEHWRGWENPSIHRTVNCWKTHNAPKSIHLLKCLANVWLYLCPQSVRNSEGPVYNLHTFISLAMSWGCRLHSCSMLRGEVFLAWTPIDDHRFGLTSAYWGLTIRSTRVCDRNETMGEKRIKAGIYDVVTHPSPLTPRTWNSLVSCWEAVMVHIHRAHLGTGRMPSSWENV